MDFSYLIPTTSNALSLAARLNDVETVRRLLNKINPNCIDNRGWTCLHEAADNDSYESLLLILKHPDCRPLVETHEGHTALFLACRKSNSLRTIKALLENVDDIANYGNTEGVTPLHLESSHGRVEAMELLIEYGAMLDVQDFDGDTPLHDAASQAKYEAIKVLLYAGASPEIQNARHFCTPFHLACFKDCFESIKVLFPFVTDINQPSSRQNTPLILASYEGFDEAVKFLLENGADPHLKNDDGENALFIALQMGCSSTFRILFLATDKSEINKNIILLACKPHIFRLEILEELLNSDLGPDFYDFYEPFHVVLEKIGDIQPTYHINPPLNSFLHISEYIYNRSAEKFTEFFYLFLMRGVQVNALDTMECPPLVYIHYCMHATCFDEVFSILIKQGCNVDYCSSSSCSHIDGCIPDAFIASLSSDPRTVPIMVQHSLYCEPAYLLSFAHANNFLGRITSTVQEKLIAMLDYTGDVAVERLPFTVPSLRHLCRLTIRNSLKKRLKRITTQLFVNMLSDLPVPRIDKDYLRYIN